MYQNYWRLGVVAGLGAVAGALAMLTVTRGSNSELRKACVSLLSHGLELKDKVTASVETAKENLEDFTAEARHATEARKADVMEAGAAAMADAEEAVDAAVEKSAVKRSRKAQS